MVRFNEGIRMRAFFISERKGSIYRWHQHGRLRPIPSTIGMIQGARRGRGDLSLVTSKFTDFERSILGIAASAEGEGEEEGWDRRHRTQSCRRRRRLSPVVPSTDGYRSEIRGRWSIITMTTKTSSDAPRPTTTTKPTGEEDIIILRSGLGGAVTDLFQPIVRKETEGGVVTMVCR